MSRLKPRERPNKPQPRRVAPNIPPAVKRETYALDCWRALTPRLLKLGLLTEVDGEMLEGLCIAYARARKADEDVATFGLVERSPLKSQANPAVAISRMAWADVRRFAAEFGMSPFARMRVTGTDGEEGDEGGDSTENFLFGHGKGKVVGKIG